MMINKITKTAKADERKRRTESKENCTDKKQASTDFFSAVLKQKQLELMKEGGYDK